MLRYITTDTMGDKFFFKDKDRQILHREDGPAIECRKGENFWFLNGVEISEEEFNKKVKGTTL
jgi:hypothetical protein